MGYSHLPAASIGALDLIRLRNWRGIRATSGGLRRLIVPGLDHPIAFWLKPHCRARACVGVGLSTPVLIGLLACSSESRHALVRFRAEHVTLELRPFNLLPRVAHEVALARRNRRPILFRLNPKHPFPWLGCLGRGPHKATCNCKSDSAAA